MRLSTTILALVMSMSAFAGEKLLAVITTEIDKDIRDFYLITCDVDNTIEAIRYITYTEAGHTISDVTISADVIMSEGAVLVYRSGHEVIRLEVNNEFNQESGGVIILNSLFNGITGSRRINRMLINRVHDKFVMTDLNHNEVNRMHVLANWNRFFGIVGVRDIRTSYVGSGSMNSHFIDNNYLHSNSLGK